MQQPTAQLRQILADAVKPVLAINVASGSGRRRSDAERTVASVVVKLARMLRRASFSCANVPWADEAPYVMVGTRGNANDGGSVTIDGAIYWDKDMVCLSGVRGYWAGQLIWLQRGQHGNKRGWVADVDSDLPASAHRWRDPVAWAHPATIAAVDAMAQSLLSWMRRYKK